MGKRLIQQRRGRGTLTYRSPSHRFVSEVRHAADGLSGVVSNLIHCAGHSAPLMEISFTTGMRGMAFAPEGIKVGDDIRIGSGSIMTPETGEIKAGQVLRLQDIPEGTDIHNIEMQPGDGGKLVRASGSFARILAKENDTARIKLPSRKEIVLPSSCRAAVGIIAGGGRPEKPFLKAGTRYYRMAARNKLYPHVCGISMNAVDHPFGGKCSHIKGRPTQAPRSAPPGRKVGKIAPRRTGRKK